MNKIITKLKENLFVSNFIVFYQWNTFYFIYILSNFKYYKNLVVYSKYNKFQPI